MAWQWTTSYVRFRLLNQLTSICLIQLIEHNNETPSVKFTVPSEALSFTFHISYETDDRKVHSYGKRVIAWRRKRLRCKLFNNHFQRTPFQMRMKNKRPLGNSCQRFMVIKIDFECMNCILYSLLAANTPQQQFINGIEVVAHLQRKQFDGIHASLNENVLLWTKWIANRIRRSQW